MKKQLLALIVLATVGSSLVAASMGNIDNAFQSMGNSLGAMAGNPEFCAKEAANIKEGLNAVHNQVADLGRELATSAKNEKKLEKMLETTMAQLKDMMAMVHDLAKAAK